MINVSEPLRARARADGCDYWLDELPSLIMHVEREWSITVGRPFRSTEAYVAEATTGDGAEAVLKLHMPCADDVARREVTALRLAGGAGCARLLREDASRGVVLLERLGPSLYELAMPIDRRHEILCSVASRIWRSAEGYGLPTGAEKGRWLAEQISSTWQQLDRPCSAEAIAHALACTERRIAAHDSRRAVLVHGDVHRSNTLRAGSGYKLIDPDGVLAEPEYDLGSIMRQDPAELLRSNPYGRARFLAARTGLDPVAVWEWGVVQRVSTGLLGTALGIQPAARELLHAADLIAVEYPEPR